MVDITSLLLFLFLVLTAVGAARVENRPQTDPTQRQTSSTRYVPNAYLVEFHDDHDHQSFDIHLQRRGISATQRRSMTSDIFKGASYQFNSTALGTAPYVMLSTLPSVKNAWPIEILSPPTNTVHWTGSLPDNSENIHERSISTNTTENIPHVMTQVDRLHAEGLSGKGIKVAILDTAIDYMHPALGGGWGPGRLITHCYAYHNNYCNRFAEFSGSHSAHGTHVAGIIAAQPNELGFIGAAPGVELSIYSIANNDYTFTSDFLAAALNQAYEDGNQIITVSAATPQALPKAFSVERLQEKGLIVTASIGNDGLAGMNEDLYPTSIEGVLSIASGENLEIPRVFLNATYRVDNGMSNAFEWDLRNPGAWMDVDLPLVVGESLGPNECDEFKNAKNLTGKIALLGYTTCTDWTWYLPWVGRTAPWLNAEHAVEKGAEYVLFYSETGAIELDWPRPKDFYRYIPRAVGTVPISTAKEFIRIHQNGGHIRLHMNASNAFEPHISLVPNPRKGLPSNFSSWGNLPPAVPSGTMMEPDIKPYVSTPGGHILSTWPVQDGKYAILSGTSMAAPLAAGLFALLLEGRKNTTVADLKTLLATTGKPMRFSNDPRDTSLAPITQQGSGLAQVWNAAHCTTILSTTKLIFRSTAHPPMQQNFTLRNAGSSSVNYTLAYRVAKTFYVPKTPALASNPENLDYSDAAASIAATESLITVPAGGTAEVNLTLTPEKLNTKRMAVLSGFVTVDGSNGDRLSIPYVAVVGKAGHTTLWPVLLVLACLLALACCL